MVRCVLADSGLPRFSEDNYFHGGVSGQLGAALRDLRAVPVQNATLDGAGSATSSSHR